MSNLSTRFEDFLDACSVAERRAQRELMERSSIEGLLKEVWSTCNDLYETATSSMTRIGTPKRDLAYKEKDLEKICRAQKLAQLAKEISDILEAGQSPSETKVRNLWQKLFKEKKKVDEEKYGRRCRC